jgi:MFS family permease
MKRGAIQAQTRLPYVEVLGHRGFRYLWFGQICSQFAFSTLLFVLGLRIYQSTGSNTAVSALFLAHSIPAILFGMVAGTLVDRLDKRRVLVACDIVRGLFVVLLAFSSHNVFVVYLLTFLNSLITQLYVPAEAPLIPKLVSDQRLVPANSLFSFTFYSSLAIGSVLAGPLLRGFGHEGVFFFIAALFWLASFFSSRIPSQSRGTAGVRYIMQLGFTYLVKRVWFRLTDGIYYVTHKKSLLEAIGLLTGTQIIFAILGTLGPGFADRILQVDVRDASLIIVGPAVLGIVAGALWLGSAGYRFGPRKLIGMGITGTGIFLMAIAISVRLLRVPQLEGLINTYVVVAVEVLMLFFLGFSNSLMDVPANAMLQEEAKGGMRGRVYGILAAFVGGVGVLPVILGGVLADVIGVGKVIFLLGCIISLYAFWRVRYNRKH